MAVPPSEPAAQRGKPVPPLPARLTDPIPVLLAGSAAWFAAFCVLLVVSVVAAGRPLPWLWVCLAGWVMGLIGVAIVRWQRSAVRRGSRTVQDGL